MENTDAACPHVLRCLCPEPSVSSPKPGQKIRKILIDDNEKRTWLEEKFSFYASYHNDAVNQFIHIICIWPILLTFLLFVTYTPTFFTMANPISGILKVQFGLSIPAIIDVNMCFIVATYYMLVYMVVEIPGIVGTLAALLVLACFLLVQHIREAHPDFLLPAIVIHVVCWLAQFYGHAFHEGRSPALLDNLYQALVMAPLFVLMEIFFVFGYRPKFRSKIQRIVDKNIMEFKQRSTALEASKKD